MAFYQTRTINQLENYLISETPESIFYIPNFITAHEEQEALQKIYAAPKPKWVSLSNRRLQNWGGLPHQKGMIAEPIPCWLQGLMTRVDDLRPFCEKLSNHVLINEYKSGQGIMPHVDGPLFYPSITTINLGSHTLLDLYSPSEEIEKVTNSSCEDEMYPTSSKRTRIGSLLLEPRSLLVLQDKCYTKLLHGIQERKEDLLDEKVLNLGITQHCIGEILSRETRVSLTIRHFPKVLKNNIFGKRK